MTTSSLLPNSRQQFFNAIGLPLAGGSVSFYAPNTTSMVNTWQDREQTSLNTNPVILDAGGFATIYATGTLRQVVQDAVGNIIYDANTASYDSGTTLQGLGVSGAMVPVLEAPTVGEAADLLGLGSTITLQSLGVSAAMIPVVESSDLLTGLGVLTDGSLLLSSKANSGVGSINISTGSEVLFVTPTANNSPTFSTFNVQAVSNQAATREFMVNFGLVSKTGVSALGNPQNGKVTLYSGLDALTGTGDVWTLNTCLTMNAASGDYTAQGIEVDLNNFNVNRGASGNLNTDFTPPTANGISISGAASFSNTTAIGIISLSPAGVTNPQWNRGITTFGRIGICGFQENTTTPVGMQFDGTYSVAAINLTSLYNNTGAVGGTGMFLKNNQTITWQNAAKTATISDTVDAINQRLLGAGSAGLLSANHLYPQLDATYDLGGTNAASTILQWRNIYISGSLFAPSDVTLKTDIKPLASMLSVIRNVGPISFTWKDVSKHGDKTHYGFDALEIKQHLPSDFAGFHSDASGRKWIVKDELIAVLWRGEQELLTKIEALETKIKELSGN